jgi:hypothetical protein
MAGNQKGSKRIYNSPNFAKVQLQENVKGLFPEVEVDPQAREALLAAAAREEENAHLLTTSAKMADS